MSMNELNQRKNLQKEEREIATVLIYCGGDLYGTFSNVRIISPQEVEVERYDGSKERIYNATTIIRYKVQED